MADLVLRSIYKSFGTVRVLEDVSFRVLDGGCTILLGPSGCGKSTLLRIIAGLEQPTAGEVLIGGESFGHRSPKDRDIAMVFQHYALYPHLTVRDNMAFGLKMRKEPRNVIHARMTEAAELLGITDLLNRKPKELSGGQRQRVAMGRAIVRKPRLFLFDEPLSNLDARLRTSMRVELKKLHQRLGTTMIYVTHDQVEAMTLGDTIVLLDQGRIRQVGSPTLLYHRPSDPFVAGFLGNPSMNLMDGTVSRQKNTWVFRSGTLSLPLPEITSAYPVENVSKTILGIRPEDLLLTAPSAPSLSLTGEVDVVEDLGCDQIIHSQVDHHHLIARVPQSHRVKPNSSVTMSVLYTRLHLFIDERRADWA